MKRKSFEQFLEGKKHHKKKKKLKLALNIEGEPVAVEEGNIKENKSIPHMLFSKRSLKDGRLWLPEKHGIAGGFYPVHNPEAISEMPTHHTATLHPDGKIRIKREN